MGDPSNQFPINTQSSRPQSVATSEAIPLNVTSIESPAAITGVTPKSPVEARLLPTPAVEFPTLCAAIQGERLVAKDDGSGKLLQEQAAAHVDATAKTGEALKNRSYGKSSCSLGSTLTQK